MTREEQIRLEDHVVRLILARGDQSRLPVADRRALKELLERREREENEQSDQG